MRVDSQVRRSVTLFLSWWVEELLGLVPRWFREWLFAPGERLVINVRAGQLDLVVENARHSQILLSGADCPDTWASIAWTAVRQSARKKPFGLRLSAQDCLIRQMELPRTAEDDAVRILELNLERSTPFKRQQVYSAVHIPPNQMSWSRLDVCHVIVSRTRLDPLIKRLAELGCPPSFVDCWTPGANHPLPINLIATEVPRTPGRIARVNKLLLLIFVALSASAATINVHKHSAALEDLEHQVQQLQLQVDGIRSKITQSKAVLQQITSLHQLKAEQPSPLEILDELTRILPDTAWINDFKLDDDRVEISGIAASAAPLITLLEQSKLFAEPAMTSPLTLTATEDKERFSIRLRIERSIQHAVAPQGEGKG